MRGNSDVVAGIYDNHPKIYLDDNGQPAGFFAELVEVIAGELNWNVEYRYGSWTENLERLEAGSIDMLVDVGYSSERAERFEYNSEGVFADWAVVYTRKGSGIEHIDDLSGVRIASMTGSIHHDGPMGLVVLNRQLKLNMDIVEVDNYRHGFSVLQSGLADAAVVNRIFGKNNASEFGVKRTAIIFDPHMLHFAFPKIGDPKLINDLDRVLSALKSDENSVYYDLIDRYIAGYFTTRDTVPLWLNVSLFISILAASLFLILGWQLYREVKNRRRSEEYLRKYQDQLILNAQQSYLGRMIQSLSHELNTPLGNGILAFSSARELLDAEETKRGNAREPTKTIEPEISELVKSYLDAGLDSLKRLSEINERFKSLHQELEEHTREWKAVESVRQICSVWQEQLRRNNISLNITGPEEESWDISIQALNTVLSELIQNSLDHGCPACSEEGEGITNSSPPVMEIHINLEKQPKPQSPNQTGNRRMRWLVDYRDTGTGIAEGSRASVFHPFETSGRRRGHLGLGMHIAYLVVIRQLAGELLCLESDVGAHFQLRLN